MKQERLVTIAIASYNNAPFIQRCVNSVICQTYKNLEILVVDDGSKDDTLTRLIQFKKDNRVCIISKENGGLSSVRQKALDVAKGDYICFIDADDYLANTYVERMLNKLIKDGTNICVCSTEFLNEDGSILEKDAKTYSCDESITPVVVHLDDFKEPNEHFSNQFFLSDSWNKMYDTSFVRESGVGFNMPKGLNGTDSVFNRRLFLHCPSYSFVDDKLYIHVMYRSSAVHRKNKDMMSTAFFIVSQLVKESHKIGQEEVLSKRLSLFYYRGLLTSFRDVNLDNSLSKKMCIKMIERHKIHVREWNIMPIGIKEIQSYELKSFVFVLRYLPFLLPIYFKIHHRIVG